MKNTIFGLITISILTISCKKDERATYLKEEAGVQPPSLAVNQTPKPSLLDQAGIQTAQNTPTATVTPPGMNPPHGQPGHRCDIPVGQPLNSKPAPVSQNSAPAQNNTQTIQIDPNALQPGKFTVDNNGKSKNIKTPKGMNPPHGEPGHRCDIPVGQPLNSKPAPTAQPTQVIAQNTPAPNPTPAPTGPKPALNPAHGEPWHNCGVKVGEPLP
ncbi:hypothetical protein SAMN05421856_104351 [Chryseobacterium taichungense]|uniref:Uncharacterized protein n=1 Tax=Chryseobacterium taichungense TaxID=295069 RepID=A0A1H7ZL89_9FLAO|nr:hypothetical protein [Chryseobacterium taichungense]SEM59001.1 hypothetical protein SAMN05421856_104351 [Chryseobacterium taichungense]